MGEGMGGGTRFGEIQIPSARTCHRQLTGATARPTCTLTGFQRHSVYAGSLNRQMLANVLCRARSRFDLLSDSETITA